MREDKQGLFPLTNVQWAYFMGRNSSYEAGGYSTHAYNEMKNNIDINRFEMALNKVIERHEMLRTIFTLDGMHMTLSGVPKYKIPVHDLRGKTKEEQEEFIIRKREKLSHYVYDPTQWPLFTIEFVKIKENLNHMFVSIDLLIADAYSINLMFREICQFYLDKNSDIPIPEKKFSDYIEFNLKLKESIKYKNDQKYWMDKISNIPLGPMLPYKSTSKRERGEFKRLNKTIDKEKWNMIQTKLSSGNILPISYLCGCYSYALEKKSTINQFSINLTANNRGRLKEVGNRIIGDFTSLIILSIDFHESNSFLEEVENIQNNLIQCYKHNSYDGIELERRIVKYHNIRDQVPFPVVFTSLLGLKTDSTMENILGEEIFSLTQTPQVYLDCQVSDDDGTLQITWDYNTSKLDTKVVEEMFEHFITKILNGVRDEKKEINSLQNVIVDYNNTFVEFKYKTLQKLIKDSFKNYNKEIALIDSTKKISYKELKYRTKKYIHLLKSNGIGPGRLVAVRGIRCAETVIKIIAIILSGAGYVPINPDWPEERVKYILQDCKAENIDRLSEFSEDLYYDKYADEEDPAYVIYTSGSTGRPKGVLISQKAIANTLQSMQRKFPLNKKDVIGNISSYGFDLSVYDIFGAVISGAAVSIISDPYKTYEIQENIEKNNITVWNSVPALLELILDGTKKQNNKLRLILLSGDWIPLSLYHKAKKIFPKAEFISLGGATEAAIWSIYFNVKNIREEWIRIPYGYPLDNQKCYVLDEKQRLCKFEEKGEIYIGGYGIANGYVNDREKTVSSFIYHDSYGRLYKTGDAGVFKKEGYIEILGRLDNQVKINGYRIETGEIEKVIEEFELVDKAFVNCIKNENSRVLVASIKPSKICKIEKEDKSEIWEQAKKSANDVPKEFADTFLNIVGSQVEKLAYENIKSTLMQLKENGGIDCPVTIDELINMCRIKEIYKKILFRWLEIMVDNGEVKKIKGKYDLNIVHWVTKEEIKTEFKKIIEECSMYNFLKDSLFFYQQCMLYTKDILIGDKPVIAILFPEGEWHVADNLYGSNPRATYYNNIVAEIVAAYSLHPIKILEIGAGTGGTTKPILKKIQKNNVEYMFTDISPFFTEKASKLFRKYSFMNYGEFNVDLSSQEQGYGLEQYDIIVAANVMHDASDLPKSLKALNHLLKPGGMLILLEMTTDTYLFMTTVELLEGFSSFNDFRKDNLTPLLSACQWRKILQKSDFTEVHIFPEHNDFGEHAIVAVKENVSRFLNNDEVDSLKEYLKERLPEYMLPKYFEQISCIPLNGNGKLDRNALFKKQQKKKREIKKPESICETELFEIWADLIGIENFGITDNFFEIGGDSLLMIKCLAEIHRIYGIHIPTELFLEKSTIEELALYISERSF